MNLKLYCPHCGRCLGECNGSDSSANCKVMIIRPTRVNNRHFIHNMKCVKCKNEVFILMEFKN